MVLLPWIYGRAEIKRCDTHSTTLLVYELNAVPIKIIMTSFILARKKIHTEAQKTFNSQSNIKPKE